MATTETQDNQPLAGHPTNNPPAGKKGFKRIMKKVKRGFEVW
ncbi:hypothetical protein SLEP1_g49213 [Rubroshorea leprosula]|uniref:Uncharacterized protein n=1 Tax=Rubroshorea leprosula TaxID=152421 RepID=A0AAV5LWY4_9ROSI|nr:hypothetical protein SLEP1_g49213 [Rubroshorea leprosula]